MNNDALHGIIALVHVGACRVGIICMRQIPPISRHTGRPSRPVRTRDLCGVMGVDFDVFFAEVTGPDSRRRITESQTDLLITQSKIEGRGTLHTVGITIKKHNSLALYAYDSS